VTYIFGRDIGQGTDYLIYSSLLLACIYFVPFLGELHLSSRRRVAALPRFLRRASEDRCVFVLSSPGYSKPKMLDASFP
jgi:hypothetical protein